MQCLVIYRKEQHRQRIYVVHNLAHHAYNTAALKVPAQSSHWTTTPRRAEASRRFEAARSTMLLGGDAAPH